MRWIFALLIPCATAFGGPILTYTFTGTAAGTIGGTPFTSAALTVSGTADASTVTCSAGICQLDLAAGVASLMIGGIGSGTFSDASYFFDNQNTAWRGLGNSGLPPTAATRLTCCLLYTSLAGDIMKVGVKVRRGRRSHQQSAKHGRAPRQSHRGADHCGGALSPRRFRKSVNSPSGACRNLSSAACWAAASAVRPALR